eukprot:GGOE01011882.1.p6 GENE.GGOE01011882.1~~GGOE01011882.1.p6  ORF type:complete len:117 (-),score=9.52 GGOE01011882.1:1163-1513(-)
MQVTGGSLAPERWETRTASPSLIPYRLSPTCPGVCPHVNPADSPSNAHIPCVGRALTFLMKTKTQPQLFFLFWCTSTARSATFCLSAKQAEEETPVVLLTLSLSPQAAMQGQSRAN